MNGYLCCLYLKCVVNIRLRNSNGNRSSNWHSSQIGMPPLPCYDSVTWWASSIFHYCDIKITMIHEKKYKIKRNKCFTLSALCPKFVVFNKKKLLYISCTKPTDVSIVSEIIDSINGVAIGFCRYYAISHTFQFQSSMSYIRSLELNWIEMKSMQRYHYWPQLWSPFDAFLWTRFMSILFTFFFQSTE